MDADEIANLVPLSENDVEGFPCPAGSVLAGGPLCKAHEYAIGLREELLERGRFCFDGTRSYFFDDIEGKLIPIERDDPDFRLLLREYGVLPRATCFGYSLDELDLYSRASGTRVTPCLVSSMDLGTGSIYLDRFDGHLYKVTADNVELVPNGTDGRLFLPASDFEPFELEPIEGMEGTPLEDDLTARFGFDEEHISRRLQERALRVWMLAAMVPELVPVLPALAVVGVIGSGKTMLLKAIGTALAGGRFKVVRFPDRRNFAILCCEKPLLFLDNCDTKTHWFNDDLAVAVTGSSFDRRKFHTNRTVISTRAISRIGLSSHAPHFTRQDVVSRLLILRTTTPMIREPEHRILAQITMNRNRIMTDIVRRLQLILRVRPDVRAGDLSEHRLADFGSFVFIAAAAEGWEEGGARELLDAILRSQVQFHGEHDNVVDHLTGLLEASRDGVVERATAREIHEMLVEHARKRGRRLADIPNPVRLGQILTAYAERPPSPDLVVVAVRVGGNVKRYRITLTKRRSDG